MPRLISLALGLAFAVGCQVHDDPEPRRFASAPSDPVVRARLDQRCGCVPAPDFMLTPAGSPDPWCYDGCNWCQCDEDGRGSCTARFCTDSGVSDAAHADR